uniref:Transmembrane protein 17 n=1 Tax=Leptocylindrus danicus TaxID=163516 RepID=A0A7S2LPI5_9STRA|mmetsp:Transcript_7576/g.11274  ORF Transcript_7576/g.11274 Transcript_7576/m.11274 type:complete len:191 (+) Transcript_7576:122-694(+)
MDNYDMPHKIYSNHEFELCISSLPLAICIYFNSYLSVAFGILIGTLCLGKFRWLRFESELQRVLLLPFFAIWMGVEALRVHIGRNGNKYENVQDLSRFLLLTIFPLFPLVLYFSLYQEIIFPCDKVFGGIMIAVLCFEVIVSSRTLRKLIQKHAAAFHQSCRAKEIEIEFKREEEEEKLQDQWEQTSNLR